ncbi:hypothetical protein FA95DRAFT_755292 [Auriscalpium vulgare]|uniref:Uncharacterized protein n=1 Tax=Auriscalpium vulgare TaxID=40419 RepID=A0ACB8SAL9_9AGAM|nr:hypothetical protein FA95DRAFT_755292 [Auriscalpium vulgare]
MLGATSEDPSPGIRSHRGDEEIGAHDGRLSAAASGTACPHKTMSLLTRPFHPRVPHQRSHKPATMSFPDTFDDYLGAVSMLGDFADAAPNKIDAPAPDAFDSELDVDLQDPEVAAYLATWQPPPAVDKTSAFHPREPGPPSLFSDTSESASGQSQSMYSFAYSLLPSPSNEATLGSEFSFNMRLQDTSEYSYSPSAYGSELASSPCLDVGISEPFTSKAFNEALITASTIDFPEFGMPPPSPPLTPPSRVPLAHPARAQVPVPVPVLSQETHSTGIRSTGARRKHICTICHRCELHIPIGLYPPSPLRYVHSVRPRFQPQDAF